MDSLKIIQGRGPARSVGRQIISIVVPCYNEDEGITATVEQLNKALVDGERYAYELLFVDDHSMDQTPNLLVDLSRRHPRLKVVRLGANAGAHVASRVGLEYCAGAATIFLTADLQEGPELVSEMVKLWEGGADVVATVAEGRDRGTFMSNLFASVYYFLIKRASSLQYLQDVRAIPRLLDRKVVDRYCQHAPPRHNMGIWILQQNFEMAYLNYVPRTRQIGASKWTLKKRLALAINSILEITPLYLTIWSGVGVVFAAAGLLLGAWSLSTTASPHFWSRLLCGLVMAVGGCILLAIGAVGTYLWRLYIQFRHGLEYNVQWTMNIESR